MIDSGVDVPGVSSIVSAVTLLKQEYDQRKQTEDAELEQMWIQLHPPLVLFLGSAEHKRLPSMQDLMQNSIQQLQSQLIISAHESATRATRITQLEREKEQILQCLPPIPPRTFTSLQAAGFTLPQPDRIRIEGNRIIQTGLDTGICLIGEVTTRVWIILLILFHSISSIHLFT